MGKESKANFLTTHNVDIRGFILAGEGKRMILWVDRRMIQFIHEDSTGGMSIVLNGGVEEDGWFGVNATRAELLDWYERMVR